MEGRELGANYGQTDERIAGTPRPRPGQGESAVRYDQRARSTYGQQPVPAGWTREMDSRYSSVRVVRGRASYRESFVHACVGGARGVS